MPLGGDAEKFTAPGWLQRVVSLPALTNGKSFTVIFIESEEEQPKSSIATNVNNWLEFGI